MRQSDLKLAPVDQVTGAQLSRGLRVSVYDAVCSQVMVTFGSVPFLVNAARDGFLAVDPRMEQVAQSLGASPWKTFLTITLPLARRNILTGAMLMWSRGISEFGAVFILVYHPMVAPVLAWNRFETYGLDYARPVAVLLLLLCVIVFLALRTLGMGKTIPKSRAEAP